jgi:hypothetical protein
MMNEAVGTGAAFATTALILRFGNNYSFFITPPFLAIAGVCWLFVDLDFVKAEGHMFEKQPTYLRVLSGFSFLTRGNSDFVLIIRFVNLERCKTSMYSKETGLAMGWILSSSIWAPVYI